MKPVAAVSSHDEHSDNGIVMSVLLRQQVDDVAAVGELRVARSTKGRAPSPPMGSPGKPKVGGGGKVHVVTTSVAKGGQRSPTPPGGLPAEGSGGQGGHIH